VELPEPLFDFAMDRVRAAGFADVQEYVRHLVRADAAPAIIGHLKTAASTTDTGRPHRRVSVSWREAVLLSIRDYCHRHGSREIYRGRILQEELDAMVERTASRGRTPEMTFNRVMQELRDERLVEFVDNQGHYRFKGELKE
jgi:hypothetical protein